MLLNVTKAYYTYANLKYVIMQLSSTYFVPILVEKSKSQGAQKSSEGANPHYPSFACCINYYCFFFYFIFLYYIAS